MKHRMHDGGEHKVNLLSTKKSYTHTCPPVTENCSVVTDPVVGSGEPYSPTTGSAA